MLQYEPCNAVGLRIVEEGGQYAANRKRTPCNHVRGNGEGETEQGLRPSLLQSDALNWIGPGAAGKGGSTKGIHKVTEWKDRPSRGAEHRGTDGETL